MHIFRKIVVGRYKKQSGKEKVSISTGEQRRDKRSLETAASYSNDSNPIGLQKLLITAAGSAESSLSFPATPFKQSIPNELHVKNTTSLTSVITQHSISMDSETVETIITEKAFLLDDHWVLCANIHAYVTLLF